MGKFFLIAAIFLSAAAAHAGPDLTAAGAEVEQTAPSSAHRSDANTAERQTVIQQQLAMQKQKRMAMQKEMQLHPIRTHLHFALLKLKQTLHRVY